MVCPMCGQTVARFADSHIVPDAMTKELRSSVKPLAVIQTRPQQNPWDQVRKNYGGMTARIVCADCERVQFQAADNYATPFWRSLPSSNSNFKLPTLADGLRSFRVRSYPANAALVHRFAIQTLLRFHLAGDDDDAPFRLVRQHAEMLTKLLVSGEPTIQSPWFVAIFYYRSPLASTIFSPSLVKDLPALYSFMVPNVEIWVAEEASAVPEPLRVLALEEDTDVWVSHQRRLPVGHKKMVHNIMAPHQHQIGKILRRP